MSRLSFFVRDERGQDLIEYALVTAVVGVLGIVTWQAIATGIGSAYGGWDSSNQAIWEPPDPGGTP